MDNPTRLEWSQRAEIMRNGHALMLDQLAQCAKGRRLPGIQEKYQILQQYIFSHLAMQTPEFYFSVYNGSKLDNAQKKIVEYLEFDVKVIKIKTLEFLDSSSVRFSEFNGDLTARIALEKEYLLSLIETAIIPQKRKLPVYEN